MLTISCTPEGSLTDQTINTIWSSDEIWLHVNRPGSSLVDGIEISPRNNIQIFWHDEHVVGEWNELRAHHSKPAKMNTEYLYGFNFIGLEISLRIDLLKSWGMEKCTQPGWQFSLILWTIEKFGPKSLAYSSARVHCMQIWGEDKNSSQIVGQAEINALRKFVPAIKEIHNIPDYPLYRRIRWPTIESARLSIIISVGEHFPILNDCLNNILENLDDGRFEILLIFQRKSAPPDLVAFIDTILQHPEFGIIVFETIDKPDSAKALNAAANLASNELLVFWSDGNRLSQPNQLDSLISQFFHNEDIATASPLLLNTNGSIAQSCGISGLGGFVGDLGFSVIYRPWMSWGKFDLTQQCTALGFRCLMTPKSVFSRLHGFARDFHGPMLSHDYCFRAEELGLKNLFVPEVQLTIVPARSIGLVESAIGEKLTVPEKKFFKKWKSKISTDEFHPQRLERNGSGLNIETRKAFQSPITPPSVKRVLCYPLGNQAVAMYRVVQPATALHDHNLIDAWIAPDELQPAEIARISPTTVLMQYRMGIGGAQLVKRAKFYSEAFMVYEVDDDLFNIPSYNAASKLASERVKEVVRKSVKMCDRVVVSTEPLADIFSELHSDVVIVKNALNPAWLDLQTKRPPINSDLPRVGWAGGGGHSGDLRILQTLMGAFKGRIDWILLGNVPHYIAKLAKEHYNGTNFHRYPKLLASLDLDLALAPLIDNPFNRSKSHLRQLEYGACGYPVLCADVFPYRASNLPVTLAKYDVDEWIEAISYLLIDREKLRVNGMALQKAVNDNWILRGDRLMEFHHAWLP